MAYDLYIDVFLFMEFAMNLQALFLTAVIMKRTGKIRRLLVPALLGSGMAVCLFLILPKYKLYLLLIYAVVHPLMVWIAFRETSWKAYFADWAVSYLAVLLVGGLMQWLYVTVFGGRHLLAAIGVTALLGLIFAEIWKRQRTVGRRIYEVELKVGADTGRMQAYYDTGNLLMDPYCQRPVHIVARECLLALLEKNQVRGRMICYSSLGREDGLLWGYTIEELLIHKGDEIVRVSPAVVGLGEDSLFHGNSYQMILNGQLQL